MELIPAVDLKDGRCVRLFQGRKDRETEYSDDPVAVARHWVDGGASRLHVVDLDGAFGDDSPNRSLVRKLLASVEVPCQVGGGLRDLETVSRVLEAGAGAAIIGTGGIRNPDFLRKTVERFGPSHVIAGVDCREGRVLVEGWEEDTRLDALEWLARLEQLGIQRVVYTDVERDGTQRGPNLDELRRVLEASDLRVIASGGVGSLDDLERLAGVESPRLEGVIVGRALYEGTFTVPEALEVLSG